MTDFTLERIVPDALDPQDAFDVATLALHRDRYQFAIEHLQPGRILDMACGSGYGAHQMMSAAKLGSSHCTALDISAEAIGYANSRYAHPAITFICGDCQQYGNPASFDGITALELIEHLPDPAAFVNRLYALLKPGGILVVSAPVTPSTDGNPHHLTDFSPRSFRKLFPAYAFQELAHARQVQPYKARSVLGPDKNKRLAGHRKKLTAFYLAHPRVFCLRVLSLFRDGLTNKYLILALKKIDRV